MGASLLTGAEKVILRCSTFFFDDSKARSTANPKLPCEFKQLDLRPFHTPKNHYGKSGFALQGDN
jgi:hypothetical protein